MMCGPRGFNAVVAEYPFQIVDQRRGRPAPARSCVALP
jgi:hypothetical protein